MYKDLLGIRQQNKSTQNIGQSQSQSYCTMCGKQETRMKAVCTPKEAQTKGMKSSSRLQQMEH